MVINRRPAKGDPETLEIILKEGGTDTPLGGGDRSRRSKL